MPTKLLTRNISSGLQVPRVGKAGFEEDKAREELQKEVMTTISLAQNVYQGSQRHLPFLGVPTH